ncbi:MAG: ATP-dependent metallopeptidase FtsH/Yme1/Tma family protein, partial [Selenomonas sp.]|nr:ATP-dependent metallopeptidase FtsH/Yme1/Tma family protein [Selenomonas sp.]
MQEVQPPKKPMAFYYILVLAVMLLFNEMARPYFDQAQIEQVDYGTFMDMTENQQISQVEIKDNQILFTGKEDNKKYKTGLVNDPELVDRLHASGAQFNQDIKEETSPIVSFFLTWILPLIIFFAIGQYFSRKLMERGGGNGMLFGMGSNQAKIYVPSSEGIHFKDVAGEDEAK